MRPTKEVFAENLRNKLYERNRSQAELAKALDVSQVIVSRWVNGISMPRANKIDGICTYLRCDRADLLTDHTQEVELAPEDIIAGEIQNNPRLFKLMISAMKLSDDKLDILIDYARKLK